MTIKIHSILKDDLSKFSSVEAVGLSNSTSMTISHFAGSIKSTEATILFEIEGI